MTAHPLLGAPNAFAPASGTPAALDEREIRQCYADVERITRLPATWRGLDPTAIVERLLELLLDMLDLDVVGFRFRDTAHVFTRTRADFAASHDADDIVAPIDRWLRDGTDAPATLLVGGDALRVARRSLGELASLGVLVVGARRPDFPRPADALRLDVAATHAALALREVRELGEQHRSADLRAERPTAEALAESAWRLHLIINTMPAMAWSATPDGMLDFCNQHFLDFVGLPAEEIMRLGFYRIFHPDDLRPLLASWQHIMASKRGQAVDGRLRRADGEYRWCTLRQNPLLDADGNVVKWYGIVLDIEDRKRAETALQATQAALVASEENVKLVIDSLPVLVWSARPDGSADFINQSWIDYAGVPTRDILEWAFLDLYHPDDIAGMVEIWKRDLAHSDRTVLKGRIRGRDGAYRWFLFSGRKLTDAHGVVRWFGCNVDIEDLQRAEEKLRLSQRDLAHATRVMTMGELAVSIAHEVNQPLMAIVTNAGTCLRWLDEAQANPALARQAAERVVRDGHRAGEIIARLRAMARKSSPMLERIDITHVVQEVLDLLGDELRRRAVVATHERARGATLVDGDRTQLQQVVLNLLLNAVEAMSHLPPDGRRLTVSTRVGAGAAHVSVVDVGVGLRTDDAERLFDAFFTTKPDGIGMGLSICRSIVEAHGGRIWASDNAPRGSVFSFTLPLAGRADADDAAR